MKLANSSQNAKPLNLFLINALSGGVAGSIAKTISAPLERVKLVLQTARQNSQLAHINTAKDCISQLYQSQGLLSFWKGNFTNVVRYFPTQGLNFAFKEKCSQALQIKQTKDQKTLALKMFLSGGIAGCMSNMIVYPLDFARTRLSVDCGIGGKRQFNGLLHCLKSVAQTEGVQGLYKGLNINMMGIFIYRGSYFGLYDYGKQTPQIKKKQENSLAFKFLFAQAVTIIAGTLSYPQDTIKRKMMMSSKNSNVYYVNAFECIKDINKQEGVKGYFRGNLSNCARCISGAACLVLFDTFQDHQNTKKY